MERNEIIHTLASLVRLNFNAILAYEAAIDAIEDGDVADFLEKFEDDHEQHVHDLSAAILHYGGLPPSRGRDPDRSFLEGMTRVAGPVGVRAALLAMQQNEALTNRAYEAALAKRLPLEAKDIIQRNFEDEKRHKAFMDTVLAEKLWESPAKLWSLGVIPLIGDSRGTTA